MIRGIVINSREFETQRHGEQVVGHELTLLFDKGSAEVLSVYAWQEYAGDLRKKVQPGQVVSLFGLVCKTQKGVEHDQRRGRFDFVARYNFNSSYIIHYGHKHGKNLLNLYICMTILISLALPTDAQLPALQHGTPETNQQLVHGVVKQECDVMEDDDADDDDVVILAATQPHSPPIKQEVKIGEGNHGSL